MLSIINVHSPISWRLKLKLEAGSCLIDWLKIDHVTRSTTAKDDGDVLMRRVVFCKRYVTGLLQVFYKFKIRWSRGNMFISPSHQRHSKMAICFATASISLYVIIATAHFDDCAWQQLVATEDLHIVMLTQSLVLFLQHHFENKRHNFEVTRPLSACVSWQHHCNITV